MAAVLSADMDHTDKVVTLIKECSRHGTDVLPPDVNASRVRVRGLRRAQHPLRTRRGARRGRGRGRGLDRASAARAAPYGSLEDLCRRLDLQKANRRVLEALLRCGSLDALGPNRATLMERLAAAMQLGDQNTRAHQAGQNDMFGPERDGARAPRAAAAPCVAARVERGGAADRASARRSACISPGIRWRASRRACRASSRTASATSSATGRWPASSHRALAAAGP